MTLERRVRGSILCVCILVGAVACGSDDGEGAIERDDFIEQGNEICRSAEAELDAAGETIDTSDEAELEEFLTDEAIPSIRGQIDDLRDLGYPEGDRDTLEAIYDEAESVLDEIEEDPMGTLRSGTDPLEGVNDDLREYGLTDCA